MLGVAETCSARPVPTSTMQRSTIIHVLRMAAVALTQAVATEDIPAAIWWLMWAAFVVEQASQYDSALRRLSRFYFTRPDLLLPTDAPAAAVLQSRTDKGMLQFMHVDRRTFDLILENVDPMWVRSRLPAGENGRVGRPNMLTGELCVALRTGAHVDVHHGERGAVRATLRCGPLSCQP